MPTWAAVLLAVLALVPIGTLVTLAYQRREATRAEHQRLRREGVEIVTPIQEMIGLFILTLPLSGWNTEKATQWHPLKRQLTIYGEAHPDDRIRELSQQLIAAVDRMVQTAISMTFGKKDEKLMLEEHSKRSGAIKPQGEKAKAAAQALLIRIRQRP